MTLCSLESQAGSSGSSSSLAEVKVAPKRLKCVPANSHAMVSYHVSTAVYVV